MTVRTSGDAGRPHTVITVLCSTGVVFSYRCRLGEGRELGSPRVGILIKGYGQVPHCDLGALGRDKKAV